MHQGILNSPKFFAFPIIVLFAISRLKNPTKKQTLGSCLMLYLIKPVLIIVLVYLESD